MTSQFSPPPSFAAPPPPAPGQRRGTQQSPSGMPRAARAVVWLSIIAAVVLVAGLSYAVWLEVDQSRLAPANRGDTGTMATMRVIEGMCIADPIGDDGPIQTVTVVECAEPHFAEVVATLAFNQPDWPGVHRVQADALSYCSRSLEPGAGVVDRDLDSLGLRWVSWVPTAATWSSGDRSAACVVSSETPMTGSFFSGTAELS